MHGLYSYVLCTRRAPHEASSRPRFLLRAAGKAQQLCQGQRKLPPRSVLSAVCTASTTCTTCTMHTACTAQRSPSSSRLTSSTYRMPRLALASRPGSYACAAQRVGRCRLQVHRHIHWPCARQHIHDHTAVDRAMIGHKRPMTFYRASLLRRAPASRPAPAPPAPPRPAPPAHLDALGQRLLNVNGAADTVLGGAQRQLHQRGAHLARGQGLPRAQALRARGRGQGAAARLAPPDTLAGPPCRPQLCRATAAILPARPPTV